jgi:hypothetical protein
MMPVVNKSDLSNHLDEQKFNNNIREIRNARQLDKINLNFDSPTMRKAMDDLGVSLSECIRKDRSHFEQKGLDNAIVELRFKHHQARLVDTLNRLLEQRRNIKLKGARFQTKDSIESDHTKS